MLAHLPTSPSVKRTDWEMLGAFSWLLDASDRKNIQGEYEKFNKANATKGPQSLDDVKTPQRRCSTSQPAGSAETQANN